MKQCVRMALPKEGTSEWPYPEGKDYRDCMEACGHHCRHTEDSHGTTVECRTATTSTPVREYKRLYMCLCMEVEDE